METFNGEGGIPADSWAREASQLPLTFAQVREDPRLDVEVLRSLPRCQGVVMISSGGDTLVQLARELAGPILAVDVNPAQLALSRLKCHLAAEAAPDQMLRMLGHGWMPAEQRTRSMEGYCRKLALDPAIFGPVDRVSHWGVDHCGRYEACFAALRHELGRWVHGFPLSHLDAVLDRVMSQTNLVALFGEQATRNPRMPFSRHFAAQTREALERPRSGQNPFLRQMYSGHFPAGIRYDWMDSSRPLRAQVEFREASMTEALASLEEAAWSMVHLSNILDWLSPEEAAALLGLAARVLHPGGKVFIRQLNSSLCIPALGPDFAWDSAAGAALANQDRSFFYPHIHVGVRQ